MDTNANSTNDILSDAISTTNTKFFNGGGSSYTGSVPNNDMKYGIFLVFVRESRKYVVSIASTGLMYTNAYTGSAWSGWRTVTMTS